MSKSKNIYDLLKADFPAEAYTEDTSRGFALTSLKAQYVVDRLNEVLGLEGWELTGEYKEIEEGVLYFGKLTAIIGDRTVIRESVGFSRDKKNVGDAYKSARTEALSKAASHLGVGDAMYKGLIAPPKSGNKPAFKGKSKGFTAPVSDDDSF